MRSLTRHQQEALNLLKRCGCLKPVWGVIASDETHVDSGEAWVNGSTAQSLERRGLVEIDRSHPDTWYLALTHEGYERGCADVPEPPGPWVSMTPLLNREPVGETVHAPARLTSHMTIEVKGMMTGTFDADGVRCEWNDDHERKRIDKALSAPVHIEPGMTLAYFLTLRMDATNAH